MKIEYTCFGCNNELSLDGMCHKCIISEEEEVRAYAKAMGLIWNGKGFVPVKEPDPDFCMRLPE